MNGSLMAVLRLVHILAGIVWVGATLFLSWFLLPAARTVGPSAGPLMSNLMETRRLQFWINVSMTLAIIAGFALFGLDSRMSGGGFGRSGMGITLSIGALLAIIAAGVGGAMAKPTGRKLGLVAQRMREAQRAGGLPSPELLAEAEPLQRKMSLAFAIMTVLLLLSAATMAIARYV
ncbi:MAG: hypothetical protein ACJ796_17910 [Gemmatimonadaceae bacterium]